MATPLETSPEVDRFSNLPNEIAHHILSLFSFKDFTRVGCVSKRCRRLHLSAPSIKFCEFSDVTNISSCDVHKQMLDSFDRFLNQRGDNEIRTFHFSWCFRSSLSVMFEDEGIPECYCDNVRLNAWIDSAVRCNVEVVQIVNSSPDWYERLPSSLLLCQSLRSLLVDGKAFIGKDVTSSTLSNLEFLELKNVMIENDKEFWKWVSYSCICIKDVHLEGISGGKDIIIDSSSLESFSFKSPVLLRSSGAYSGNLNISGDRLEKISINGVASDSSFMISAPNLKRLRWHGSFARQHNFGELPCLEIAHISGNSFFKEVNHLGLFGLLCSIPQVKVLILCQGILKAVLKQGFMSVQLDCVRDLRLTSLVLTDDLIPALITLLGVMPNLSSLYMKSMISRCNESQCAGFDMEFWKVQNLAFIDKIKEVTLDVCRGSNVLEFARYILEHAQNLKKVVLYHFRDQCDDVMKLQSHMISNPIVLLHQEERSPFGLLDFDLSEI